MLMAETKGIHMVDLLEKRVQIMMDICMLEVQLSESHSKPLKICKQEYWPRSQLCFRKEECNGEFPGEGWQNGGKKTS